MDRPVITTLNAIAYTTSDAYFYKRTELSAGMKIRSAHMLSTARASVCGGVCIPEVALDDTKKA